MRRVLPRVALGGIQRSCGSRAVPSCVWAGDVDLTVTFTSNTYQYGVGDDVVTATNDQANYWPLPVGTYCVALLQGGTNVVSLGGCHGLH